jgi:myo-inositol-1(or 4)-monophosphatase
MRQEFVVAMTEMAEKSGDIIRSYFRKKIAIDEKADQSPVTIADKTAEQIMRDIVRKKFPDHGIIGEEFGNDNPDAEFVWIFDPIDGTKSFIHGAMEFGSLIALRHGDSIILGAFHQPIMRELVIGDGITTQCNGEPVFIRPCRSLADATLLTTDHLDIEKYQDIKKFDTLLHQVKLYRSWGDCFGYYLVATGFADIMIDGIMNIWDSAALIPIIRGAGGIITDYQGNDPMFGNSIIAAGPGIHEEVIRLLNS